MKILNVTHILYRFFLPAVLLQSLLSGCTTNLKYYSREPSQELVKGECVALVHGMGRSYKSLIIMQESLTEAGYHTVNLNYPSTDKDIESIAAENFPLAISECEKFDPSAIHFVTHSLGGIILRTSFKNKKPAKLGKTVMLSPPNQGSTAADKLKDWILYKWINGPAGQQLTTDPDSLPNQLGPVDYPVGIIMGTKHAFFDSWLADMIPGHDDGKVSIDEAMLDGMTDFVLIDASHPYIMKSDLAIAEVLYFLENGKFMHRSRIDNNQ